MQHQDEVCDGQHPCGVGVGYWGISLGPCGGRQGEGPDSPLGPSNVLVLRQQWELWEEGSRTAPPVPEEWGSPFLLQFLSSPLILFYSPTFFLSLFPFST